MNLDRARIGHEIREALVARRRGEARVGSIRRLASGNYQARYVTQAGIRSVAIPESVTPL